MNSMTFKDSGKMISNNIAFGWIDPDGLTFPMHDHDYFEISMMIEGRVWHVMENESYIMSRGDVIFVRPWDYHDFRMVNDEHFMFLNIPFDKSVLEKLRDFMEEESAVQTLLDAPEPPRGKIDVMEICELEKMYNEMDNIQRIRRSLYMILVRVMNNSFFSQHDDKVDRGPAWFQRLCMEMMMINNLSVGLPRMYELCNRSPEHISRTFKKYMNMSPTAFINSLRIDKACEKLKHSKQSILDIAYSLGFESVSYFYRVFRDLVGMTPLEYRNSSGNAD